MTDKVKFNEIDIELYRAFKDISNKQFDIIYNYSSLLLYTLAGMQPIGNMNKEYESSDYRIKIKNGYIYVYDDTYNLFYNIAVNDVVRHTVAKIKLMNLLQKYGNDILNYAVEFSDDLQRIIEINDKIINNTNTKYTKEANIIIQHKYLTDRNFVRLRYYAKAISMDYNGIYCITDNGSSNELHATKYEFNWLCDDADTFNSIMKQGINTLSNALKDINELYMQLYKLAVPYVIAYKLGGKNV